MRILQKTQKETRQKLAFESHGAGCLLILGYLVLSDPMLGKNSLFYSEDNTKINSWLNLIVMTEQNSITSTQKKDYPINGISG